jgi:protocatechuate 3,4-dioxygenase beta subunit
MSPAFTTDHHLNDVLESFDETTNPRLTVVLRSLVTHLHAFVEEVGLTREEWMTGIEFLTATGQKCDAQRQEFILLSDTLGVSMLVEMVNQDPSDGATEPTVLGPFYLPGAPERTMGDSIAPEGSGGEDVVISGVVRAADAGPLSGAVLEVWQVTPNGFYDVQDPSIAPMSHRGVFRTGADGRFEVRTTVPVDYQIPTDGPVGTMLTATGRPSWRPAHTHFMVSHPGYKTVITHVFDVESPHLDSDAVFGVRDSLVVDFSTGSTSFDFVLDPLE